MKRHAKLLDRFETLDITPAARSGIYFFIKEEEVVYIGKSVSVLSRLHRHERKADLAFDKILLVEFPPDELDMAEALMIEAFSPKGNRKGGATAGDWEKKEAIRKRLNLPPEMSRRLTKNDRINHLRRKFGLEEKQAKKYLASFGI